MKIHPLTRAFFLLPGICYLSEFLIWRSFPQTHSLNAILGGLWTLGQIGILSILWCLYKEKITGGSKWRILGIAIAGAGAISYSINYIFGYWLDINTKMFLPMGALLSGIGMLVTGIQVIAAKRWAGLAKFSPLLVGLYPFTVMFPLLVITGHPDLIAIMAWGIPWLLMGVALTFDFRVIATRNGQQQDHWEVKTFKSLNGVPK